MPYTRLTTTTSSNGTNASADPPTTRAASRNCCPTPGGSSGSSLPAWTNRTGTRTRTASPKTTMFAAMTTAGEANISRAPPIAGPITNAAVSTVLSNALAAGSSRGSTWRGSVAAIAG